MCTHCCCYCQPKEKTPLEIMQEISEKREKEKELEGVRSEYVIRNIPIILDLVRTFNELNDETPLTAKDAYKKQERVNILAYQICKYVK